MTKRTVELAGRSEVELVRADDQHIVEEVKPEDAQVAAPGPKGDKGDKGDPGASIKGDKGDQGDPGIPGPAGKDGEPGLPGASIKGDPGAKGDRGDQGDRGNNGWSPILAIKPHGERRVLEVIGWEGGDGDKPPVGGYLGVDGFVKQIEEAVDIRGERGEIGPRGYAGGGGGGSSPGGSNVAGPKGDQGDPGPKGDPGAAGDNGWSPILVIIADGDRQVLQISDWTGGTGTKPASGSYLGATGLVSDIALAINIRGSAGQSGIQGEPGADGSNGAPGAKGDPGDPGPPGPPGEKGDEGNPGSPGAKGDKGDKGDQGNPGPPGLDGEDGGEGPPGLPGLQGLQGLQGSPGIDGEDGQPGPPGPGFQPPTGTFTPTLVSTGGGTPTYGTQSGWWTIIGDRVFYNVRIILTNLSTLAAGNITIAGLPFTSNAVAENRSPAATQWNGLTAAATGAPAAQVAPGATSIVLALYAAGATTAINQALLTNTSAFSVSGNYMI